MMHAAVFSQHGDPAEVLEHCEVSPPRPRRGEVRVRMIASPINPSDLLVVRGEYGRLPRLPATPGFEGVGVVEESGGGLLGRRVLGKRVAVINAKGGNWAQQVVIPARQAVPVPRSLPDEQVACFFVNPATALIMIERVLRVPRGEWLLQTAAASALGKMIVRLGKHLGFRTLNIVRRPESAEELRGLGADAVIDTSREELDARVPAITGAQGVRLAVDAVGGRLTGRVLNLLAPGGHLLNYGVLSAEPMLIPPRALLVGSKRLEGFWLSDWAQHQHPLTLWRFFRRLARLIGAGVLATDIGATIPLSDIRAAVQEAARPGRQGKVLVRL
jgi:NADPH:quinone reductase-like Zn-dependent oxidoreductase